MGKCENVTGTICNMTVDNINVTNLLPRTVDSNRLLIVNLKRKVEYRGHVLFEEVRSGFLRRILSSLKKKKKNCKDIVATNDLEEVIPRSRVRLMV